MSDPLYQAAEMAARGINWLVAGAGAVLAWGWRRLHTRVDLIEQQQHEQQKNQAVQHTETANLNTKIDDLSRLCERIERKVENKQDRS